MDKDQSNRDGSGSEQEEGKDLSKNLSIEEEFEDNPYSQLTKHIRNARAAQKADEEKAASLEKAKPISAPAGSGDAPAAADKDQIPEGSGQHAAGMIPGLPEGSGPQAAGPAAQPPENAGQASESGTAVPAAAEADEASESAENRPAQESDHPSDADDPGKRIRVVPEDDDFDEDEELERRRRISATRVSMAHDQKTYVSDTSQKHVLRPQAKAAIIGSVVILAGILIWAFFIRPGTLTGLPGTDGSGTGEVAQLTGMTEDTAPDPETETQAQTDPVPDTFSPHSVDSTNPNNLIEYTEVEVNGTVLSDISQYQPWYHMNFGAGDTYTDVEGIVTFRGNNFRDHPSFGEADIEQKTVEGVWTQATSGITYNGVSWSGNGWTGQPLMMKWPRAVKQHMNMYDSARQKDDLVEVIYASMDGYIYFLDLESGEYTRDPMYLGWCFKGAGALDPRGYPILYLGAGYDSDNGTSHAFIINLLDCSVMYEFGENDEFSLRGQLSYFDSSALVDASSDTLIYPGENGIIYLIHLGTRYDEAAGTLSVNPSDVVKWRYYGTRTSVSSYWLGMEDSAAVYEGYLFIADNGGNLMCLDLNTLQLVWVQDTLDDSNSTPVLSVEDGHLYLYCSTSFHLGWRSSTTAQVPVWKIDAETGEIVWQTEYNCASLEGVSGGVQSTIAVGKNVLSDTIYVTVSMTGDNYSGVLACLNKQTGETVWEHRAAYAWSSPVCVYSTQGSGYVLYCDSAGNLYMLNGLTGDVLSTVSLSEGTIEASPAVYNNYVVIGTRACQIWGLELK